MESSSDEELDNLIQQLSGTSKPREYKERTWFNVEEHSRNYREKFRVPPQVMHYLVRELSPLLQHKTQRNHALAPEQQLKLFIHFLGCNSFYHELKSIHGIASSTVCRIVSRVKDAILTLVPQTIKFPRNLQATAEKFRKVANIPSIIGCIDGSKVRVKPLKAVEEQYVDRHGNHSLNLTIVSGPNNEIFFASSNCSGRWHDTRVLKSTSLWTKFEDEGILPIPGAVFLGDSAYPCKKWLIPPFRGNVQGAKLRFNKAHSSTRSVVERTFGLLKARFTALQSELRVQSLNLAGELILCACVLHNLCLMSGDRWDVDEDPLSDNEGPSQAQQNEREDTSRRQELLLEFSS